MILFDLETLVVLLLALRSLTACLAIFIVSQTAKADPRVLLQPNSFAFYSVGIMTNTWMPCSVTFIGRRIAITNRHCFFPPGGKGLDKAFANRIMSLNGNHARFFERNDDDPRISTGLSEKIPKLTYRIREAWWGESDRLAADWALLLLTVGDQRSIRNPKLGRVFPGDDFLTYQTPSPDMMTPHNFYNFLSSFPVISLAGYSDDILAAFGSGHIQESCEVQGTENGLIDHSCYSSIGTSGAPMWLAGTRTLIGINSNIHPASLALKNDESSAWKPVHSGVPIINFYPKLAELLRKYGGSN